MAILIKIKLMLPLSRTITYDNSPKKIEADIFNIDEYMAV